MWFCLLQSYDTGKLLEKFFTQLKSENIYHLFSVIPTILTVSRVIIPDIEGHDFELVASWEDVGKVQFSVFTAFPLYVFAEWVATYSMSSKPPSIYLY